MWIPPIQKTIALDGTGVQELGDQIARHKAHLEKTGEWESRGRTRLQAELDNLLQNTLVNRWRDSLSPERYQEIFEQLIERNLSPRQAVDALLNGGPRR